jgi:hypothetical protein
MLKKITTALVLSLALAACGTDKPHIIQASAGMEEVHLTGGMASQIELPDGGHVQSVVVGNPSLLAAERSYNVVNLIPKEGVSGETNLIVRYVDDGGTAKVYQYRIQVQER